MDLRVANFDLLGAMIRRFSIMVPGGSDRKVPFNLEARVRAVAELVELLFGKDEIADCASCGGTGPWEMPHCAYCGSGVAELETREAKRVQMEQRKAEAIAAANGKKKAATSMVKRGERDLDNNVAAIREAMARTAICAWELGSLIGKNKREGLWKLRSDSKGGPKYTKFAQFATEELKISRPQADKLANVAEAFTREQVKKVGPNKLSLVLQLSEADKKKLLGDSPEKASAKMLDDAATKLKKAKADADASAAKPPKEPKISIASVLGEQEIPFVVPGKNGKTRPAKVEDDLDQAFASEKFVNGVQSVYRLQANTRGQLVLRIERARIS